jgi:hypothetical protein
MRFKKNAIKPIFKNLAFFKNSPNCMLHNKKKKVFLYKNKKIIKIQTLKQNIFQDFVKKKKRAHLA